jgi:RNA polymerase sigma-70 factor, ECF subfamily
MNDQDWLAERFEQNRGHLRAVAYRMLGSLSEADDAIQETWLRLGRSDASSIGNLGGWLTTVVARVCLDMLRSRTSRREESLDTEIVEPPRKGAPPNPEQEAVLADSVGLALLVVLDRLSPAERLAFVLHDLFAVPFDEIARIVGRTEEATRQLASRARRRVQGGGRMPDAELHQQRDVVDKFLAALRAGDFEALVAVLDPDVLVHIDEAAAAPGAAREIRGAATWAKNAIAFSRGARFVRPVLVDGTVGAMLAPQGHLSRVLRLTIKGGKIAQVDIIGDPVRLQELDLAVLEN